MEVDIIEVIVIFTKEFRDAKEKLRKEMKENGISTKDIKLGDIVHSRSGSGFPAKDIWCDEPELVQTEITQKTPHYITEDEF